MKTLRDLIFDRHRAAVPLLDSIRAEVVSRLSRRDEAPRGSLLFAATRKLWEELVWPCRRAWTGFAVVWIALLGVHLATPREAVKVAPIASQAFAQRQRLLAELLHPTRAEAHKPFPIPPPQARRWDADGDVNV